MKENVAFTVQIFFSTSHGNLWNIFFFYISLVEVDQINHFKGLNSSNLNGLQGGVGHFLLLPSRSVRKVEEIKYKFPFVAIKKNSTVLTILFSVSIITIPSFT